jgi:hypothetical protein
MWKKTNHSVSVARRLTSTVRSQNGKPTRRRFLMGAGGMLALPSLSIFDANPAFSQQATTNPQRLVIYFYPNGRLPEIWLPSAYGTTFDMPSGSVALTPFKQDLVFMRGFRNTAARLSTEVAGDHARGCSGVSTCIPVSDMLSLNHNIISVDQKLANALNPQTRFRSLQYTAGEPFACDRGASCAYTQAISWAGANLPLTPIAEPLSAFNQLFGAGEGDTPEQQQARRGSLKSMLDFVSNEATVMGQSLGTEDRMKLEEYTTAVRELERQITQTSEGCMSGEPPGTGLTYAERVTAFHDLMALALQCDQTRIMSFMIEYGLSSRSHPELNAPGGHHAISHYGNDEQKQQLIRLENWQGDQLGAFCTKIAGIKEADGTSILDNTMVLCLPSMGHGNPHDHDDVSPVFIGKLGGKIKGGQYLNLDGVPLGNMHVTVLKAFGVDSTFGMDGTSVINGILNV